MAILTLKQSYEAAHAFLEIINPILNGDDRLKSSVADSLLDEFWNTSGNISHRWKYDEIDLQLDVDDSGVSSATPERRESVLEAVYDLWGMYEKKWRPQFYDIHHVGVDDGLPVRPR